MSQSTGSTLGKFVGATMAMILVCASVGLSIGLGVKIYQMVVGYGC